MLLFADADLAERDVAIPGLSLVLDPNALLDLLRSALHETDLRAVRIIDVKYWAGRKCTVACQLELADSVVDFYAKACRSETSRSRPKVRLKMDPPGPLGPGRIAVKNRAVLFSFYPHDRKLAGLRCLTDGDSRRSLLREILPERPDLWDGTLQRIGWKPERRYVARLVTNDGVQAALKFWTASGYALNRSNVQSFTSRGLLRIARLMAQSDQHGVLGFEWLPGQVLRNVYADPELDLQCVESVGRALAELHAQTSHGLAVRTPQVQVERLRNDTAWIGFLSPQLADQANDLAQLAAKHLERSPGPHSTIHGDFSPKQVLLGDSDVGIVDFDDAARGESATDLGKFVAHLERDGLYGYLSSSRAGTLKDAFLTGYQSATDCAISPRLDLYTAVGLIRIATHPFRCREPDWIDRTESLLQRAAKLLA